MQVITVPHGQNAPDGVDWLQIDRLPSGGFQYSASVAISPTEAIFNSGPFDTAQTAKEVGLKWAEEQGATDLYVSDQSHAVD
jgi:hypothetical protein